MNNLVIHHHFYFSRGILLHPEHCRKISFENIPFFKLYDMRDQKKIEDTLNALSWEGMPHEYQKIISKLKPHPCLESCCYREELIKMRYCRYNNQSFFVRVYRLRQNSFLKVEIILHSDTLRNRKYYDFPRAIKGAESFFSVLEAVASSLSPLDLHKDEYFFIPEFEKQVGAFQKELDVLREHKYLKIKRLLIETFKENLLTFKKDARDIAEQQIISLRKNETMKSLCSNLPPLLPFDKS